MSENDTEEKKKVKYRLADNPWVSMIFCALND
jgi:hypothetical protein